MVENDVINTIDNKPEVVQPIEAVKSPVISDEENSSISNENQLEMIVRSGITNSPTIPCASSNVNNSSDGSIDSTKITTAHHSQISPQIYGSSKGESASIAETASVFEPHTCEDCIKKDAEIVNLRKRITNLEFLYDSLSDLYERQKSDLFKDNEIKMLKVGFQLAIVDAIHALKSPTSPSVSPSADTSNPNMHYPNSSSCVKTVKPFESENVTICNQASASELPSSEFFQGIKKVTQTNPSDLVLTEDNLFLKSSGNDTSLKIDNDVELTSGNYHPMQSYIQKNEFSDLKCNQPNVCFRFLDSRCMSSNCKYLHICKFHVFSRCMNNFCKYPHVDICKRFSSGRCFGCAKHHIKLPIKSRSRFHKTGPQNQRFLGRRRKYSRPPPLP